MNVYLLVHKKSMLKRIPKTRDLIASHKQHGLICGSTSVFPSIKTLIICTNTLMWFDVQNVKLEYSLPILRKHIFF